MRERVWLDVLVRVRPVEMVTVGVIEPVTDRVTVWLGDCDGVPVPVLACV